MPRVVFALPFRSNVVSGGQKMIYQAAGMLAAPRTPWLVRIRRAALP
jgi:hypothetical protein